MTNFAEIDARRKAHGLTRAAVYRKAKVNGETWRRLDKGLHAANSRTLEKLSAALDELINERAA